MEGASRLVATNAETSIRRHGSSRLKAPPAISSHSVSLPLGGCSVATACPQLLSFAFQSALSIALCFAKLFLGTNLMPRQTVDAETLASWLIEELKKQPGCAC